MKTSKIGGIPVYEALVSDEDCGMVRISFVDAPAVLTNWQKFAEDKAPQRFAIQDEDQRIVRGVVMRADFPIYRNDPAIGEYYVIYRPETIRQMAEKYLAENRQNRVDTDHDGDEVRGVQMVQYFIKDTAAGVNPAGFEDVADGSLFAEFHIVNEDLWAAIKAGQYLGFSLEGFFGFTPEVEQADVDAIVEELDRLGETFSQANNQTDKQIIMTKVEKTLARLRELLEADKKAAKFGAVTTDRGPLQWDGEEDLKAGDEVFVLDEDGNRTPAPEGDYMTEDGKTIVVVDGRVAEIRDPEAEVAPAAEEGEEQAAPVQASEEFTAQRVKMEESYDEKFRKIAEAVKAALNSWDFYIVEAGDDFAVASVYGPDGDKYFRYEVAWDEDGNAIVSNPVEVKPAFVPEDADPAAAIEEEAEQLRSQLADAIAANTALEAEIETLRAELKAAKAQPAARPAHEEVKASNATAKTGVKGLDRLAALMSK